MISIFKKFFTPKFKVSDVARVFTELILDQERTVKYFFKESNLSEHGLNKDRIKFELMLVTDFILAVMGQREAIKLNKEKLGEKIWDEHSTQLINKMGADNYNHFVEESMKRREAYLKIFNPKDFNWLVAHVFLGFACDGKPRYSPEEFLVGGFSLDYSVVVLFNTYLGKQLITLTLSIREMLNKVQE